MIITRGTLKNAGVGFNAAFKNAYQTAVSQYALVATETNSTTQTTEYGWLSYVPQVREWIGDRQRKRVEAAAYSISNKDWEITLEVPRKTFEDDNLGILSPTLAMMGTNTKKHYDRYVFQTLAAGFSTECYDGQPYFDTEHPLIDKDGNPTTFANTDGGAGNPWFLVPKNQPLLPVILQKRRDYEFVSKASPNDEGVFFQNVFVYGADARYATGYSLPQLCWGSKQALDAAHFDTAMQAMIAMKLDGGTELANTEFNLVVGPSNRAAGAAVVSAERLASGASNINWKAADLVVSPYLA